MPAAEAEVMTDDQEVVSYELAFHVLPTVAEGEVATTLETIKQAITAAGGVTGLEEAPQRFDLAYEITKMIDGKYRRFTTAYFGWVRFTAAPAVVTELMAEVEAHPSILRALLVKLTKQEEAHPFYFHEALNTKRVSTVDTEATPAEATPETGAAPATEEAATETETPAATEETEAAATDEAKPAA